MDDGIKQRLIGAVVLVALMIVFLPMLLSDKQVKKTDILIEMPAKPSVTDFSLSGSKDVAAKPSNEQLTEQTLEELAGKKFDNNNLPVSWTLQVGSFKERANAEKLRDVLRKNGYKAYLKFQVNVEPKIIRVFVGPVLDRKTIDDIKASIDRAHKLDGVVVRYLP
jgi:DedD protein